MAYARVRKEVTVTDNFAESEGFSFILGRRGKCEKDLNYVAAPKLFQENNNEDDHQPVNGEGAGWFSGIWFTARRRGFWIYSSQEQQPRSPCHYSLLPTPSPLKTPAGVL